MADASPRRLHRAPLFLALLSLSLATAAGCGDDGGDGGPTPPAEPTPGTVEYEVTYPDPLLGGILFSVPADRVTGVEPLSDDFVSHEHESDGTLYVALLNMATAHSGSSSPQVRVRLSVNDVDDPPPATLIQAINLIGQQRPLTGYSVEVVQ